MSESVTIALSHLVLWYNPTRIQAWPVLLSRVPEEMKLPSPTDFGRLFYTDRKRDEKHSAAQDIVRNLPGLEMRGKRIVLAGIGLLDRLGKDYLLSNAARQLVRAYRADSSGLEWVRVLAKQLLTREPRTRILVKRLSHPGAMLHFTNNRWFGGSLKRAELTIPGKPTIFPFGEKDDERPNLVGHLRDEAWWALGAWQSHSLVHGANNCQFIGLMKNDFSFRDIGIALRSACEVLLYLGILRSSGGTCWLDQGAAVTELGNEVAKDFGWLAENTPRKSITMILTEILAKLRSDTGYVVASELRDALRAEGVEYPDRQIAELEEMGRLVIEAESYGQSRHGEGLYSDPRKQLVKISIR